MEEFLRQNYSLITLSVEILAAATGLLVLKKYKRTAAIYFVYFLVYVVFLELIGRYPRVLNNLGLFHLVEGTFLERNYWWYSITWTIGSALFYQFYYRKIINSEVYRRVLKYSTLVFITSIIMYIIFNLNAFLTLSNILISSIGLTVILLGIVFYFMEILTSERILYFYRSLNFYVSAVILIWFLITTPMMFYEVYFSTADWNFVILKWQIYLFANCFMYLTFTFALLWCRPEND